LPPKKNLWLDFAHHPEQSRGKIVLSAFASRRGGRKGDSVFALPPAEPVNEIGSDIFKYPPPVMKTIEEILKLPNNENKVIELDNYIFELEQSKGFDNLTNTEKVIFCIENLEREVNNGGFNQFFVNSSGNYWKQTQETLKEIGALKTLDIFARALSVFSNTTPSIDRDTRINEVEALGDEKEKFLYDLDRQFYKYEDDIGRLLLSYVDAHVDGISRK